ncbi:MAG: DUF1810 domain-containing protein [Oscillospiraceae bacterium]|nr:DUF1810 domain-containing protein [Oscillospiraceae bacterium]
MEYKLERFRAAQRGCYEEALAEMRRGRKNGHWMWYIFPQLSGLGMSATSLYYGIRDLGEARAYLEDPVLGARLLEISETLLRIGTDNAGEVFWYPDDLKLRSCMTLFAAAAPEQRVFRQVLDKFFGGEADSATLSMLGMDEL